MSQCSGYFLAARLLINRQLRNMLQFKSVSVTLFISLVKVKNQKVDDIPMSLTLLSFKNFARTCLFEGGESPSAHFFQIVDGL